MAMRQAAEFLAKRNLVELPEGGEDWSVGIPPEGGEDWSVGIPQV